MQRIKRSFRTANEEGIASKDGLARAVFHEEADAVLGVAWRVDALDGNVANLEGLLVLGCLGHALAVLAANDVELGCAESLELCHLLANVSIGRNHLLLIQASCFRQHGPNDWIVVSSRLGTVFILAY